jgi:glycosyltransferase involved in cell wall biosynthesis
VPEEEIRRVRRKYAIDGEYILYVGSLHPRRQIPELLAAVAGSGREGALDRTLVLVGHNNYCPRISISELIRKGGAQSAATYLDFVPEEDLLPLYAGCDIVAYISRYEGFGLPVVEGMACGKPVVTSNNGALREVAGDGAVLVDPTNVAEIRGAFQRLINDRTYYEEIRRKGFQRCQEFSWAKSADGFLAIIREVLREES